MNKEKKKLMIIIDYTNQPPGVLVLYHNHYLGLLQSNTIMAKWLHEKFQNFIT